MNQEVTQPPRARRGIYLLPNLFTTAGLFAGFYAIVAAMGGKFESAAVAIFVAMVMDGLDGRVARLTHTQSEFGEQYDSLADMVSFGLAPALVMYEWALIELSGLGWIWSKIGWLAAFFYAAAAALRLARFNAQADTADKRYFQGLASPAAAALMAGCVWVGYDFGVSSSEAIIPAFLITVGAGALMVSNIVYYSFKGIDLRDRVPFVAILLVVLIFVFISIDPPKVLFAVSLVYALSGPVITLVRWRRRKLVRREAVDEVDVPDD